MDTYLITTKINLLNVLQKLDLKKDIIKAQLKMGYRIITLTKVFRTN